MTFRTTLRVRFSDEDHARIVYYPRFFHFFHTAFEDFFESEGIPYRVCLDEGVGWPAVHAEADFESPVRFGDDLEIAVDVGRLGRSSATFEYQGAVRGREGIAVRGRVVVACLDMSTYRAREIPAKYRALFEKHLPRGGRLIAPRASPLPIADGLGDAVSSRWMKALIKVGYGCNDHCTFCHTLDVRHIEGEASEVHAKIARAKELGHTMVVLSGGEPTIRPELVRWAEHVSRLGMGFGLVTNGRMLRYPELVETLIARRLEYVYLSLHGGSPKVHNLMVRSDAFEETFGALENLSGRGLDLTVNCVITRHNVGHLIELVDAVLPFRDAKLKLSMVEPKGGGDKLFEHLVPRVEDVAGRVREALEHGRERAGTEGPRLVHGGIPLCLLPGWEHAYDDLRTHGFRTMVEIGEPDFFPVDDRNKVQPEAACGGCALRGACPGLYRAYEASFGSSELRPRRGSGARGNSFDFVAERIVRSELPPLITTETCPVRELGITPWDHARDLHVRNGSRLVRFRASGRDFSDVELTAAKLDTGQLYVDVSTKVAPDDFSRDLRKLVRSPLCAPCADRERCAGLFELAEDDVFARDDARVRAWLSALAGDVLDVGCGELRYASELDRPEVRYVGIDPDAARLEALSVRFPRAHTRLGTAEAIEDEAAFDAILVLHSWNHLVDPTAALQRVRRALRPGGVLLVVDDVAFGLVRSVPRARAARGAPLSFEHHRLDDDAICAAALRQGGLEVVGTTPVGPTTSNQWIVEARRP